MVLKDCGSPGELCHQRLTHRLWEISNRGLEALKENTSWKSPLKSWPDERQTLAARVSVWRPEFDLLVFQGILGLTPLGKARDPCILLCGWGRQSKTLREEAVCETPGTLRFWGSYILKKLPLTHLSHTSSA